MSNSKLHHKIDPIVKPRRILDSSVAGTKTGLGVIFKGSGFHEGVSPWHTSPVVL